MDSRNYDDEIFADNLSNHSEDLNLPVFDNYSDCTSDGEVSRHRKISVVPLRFSDSETSAAEDDTNESSQSRDNPPEVELFLGQTGFNIFPNNPENIIDPVNLFIGDDLLELMGRREQ